MKNILLFALILFTGFTWAQEQSFSDETLQKFAQAYKEVRNENMTLQLNMISAIEDAGLTSDEFTDIHMQMKKAKEEQPTPENKRKYNIALKNIETLNQDIQESIERIIQSHGLKVETYHSIANAYSNNNLIKQKIQKLIN